MGLFKNNKELCPICGGPTPRLLATEVEGEKICSDCEKKICMGPKKLENLTIEKLKRHLEDREANAALHEEFNASRVVEIGYKKICVDDEKRLFYIDDDLTKNPPIFKFEELKAFKYREWINGKVEDKFLAMKASVPFFGFDDDAKRKRGMRTVISYTKDERTERDSYIELLRDEVHGIVRSDNIISELLGEDEKMLEDKKPIETLRMVFELSNKWWGKYKVDLTTPWLNPSMNREMALWNYIENYDETLKKVKEVAEIMGSILDSVTEEEIPVAAAIDEDE